MLRLIRSQLGLKHRTTHIIIQIRHADKSELMPLPVQIRQLVATARQVDGLGQVQRLQVGRAGMLLRTFHHEQPGRLLLADGTERRALIARTGRQMEGDAPFRRGQRRVVGAARQK